MSPSRAFRVQYSFQPDLTRFSRLARLCWIGIASLFSIGNSLASSPSIDGLNQQIIIQQTSPVSISFEVNDPENDPVQIIPTGLPPGISIIQSPAKVDTVLKSAEVGEYIEISNFGHFYTTSCTKNSISYSIRGRNQVWSPFKVIMGGSQGVDDGLNGVAKFNCPKGLAIDLDSDTLFVADYFNGRVRKIASTAGGHVSSTFAKEYSGYPTGYVVPLTFPHDVALLGSNVVALMPSHFNTYDSAGKLVSQQWAKLNDVALHKNGDLYATERAGYKVFRITPTGTVETIAGGTSGHKDGFGAAAKFLNPVSIGIAPDGMIFVADYTTIRRLDTLGNVSTYAGTQAEGGYVDGSPKSAKFQPLGSMVIDRSGSIFVSDWKNQAIRRITRAKYAIQGTYSGQGCGGQFPVTLRAKDSTGQYSDLSLVFVVPRVTSSSPVNCPP